MRIAVLLAIAVAAFLGATLVPGDGPEPATGDDGPHAPQPAKAETSGGSSDSYAAWVAGTTELPRAADGHFYAETQVNGARRRKVEILHFPFVSFFRPNLVLEGLRCADLALSRLTRAGHRLFWPPKARDQDFTAFSPNIVRK